MGPTLLEAMLLSSAVIIINCYFLMFALRGELAQNGFDLGGLVASRIFFILLCSLTVLFLCEFGHRTATAVSNLLVVK